MIIAESDYRDENCDSDQVSRPAQKDFAVENDGPEEGNHEKRFPGIR